jgi:hypothetical protein
MPQLRVNEPILGLNSNKGSLPDICSLSQFGHQIEDDRMSYEPIEYPNKKIILSKNVQ